MQLHIISQSPASHSALDDALAIAAAGDTLVLINDGCYALANPALISAILSHCPATITALQDELLARGISCPAGVEAIDMDSFVQLVFAAKQCVSWY